MNEDLRTALEVLKKGGIILYPTDTVWGLGCDATNENAVQRIYTIKKREDSLSMLVLMENPALLDRYVTEIPEIAWDLIEVADAPLTIIYPQAKNLAKNLLAEDGSIGIRFIRHPFTSELIARFRKPIVSTSANISGQPTPVSFDEIPGEIRELADYIVQYRQTGAMTGKPSSIIKLGTKGEIKIIRE